MNFRVSKIEKLKKVIFIITVKLFYLSGCLLFGIFKDKAEMYKKNYYKIIMERHCRIPVQTTFRFLSNISEINYPRNLY